MEEKDLQIFFSKYGQEISKNENSYISHLKSFFDKFSYRYETYLSIKKEMDKKLSSDFNTFDYISNLELGLSNVIAMMLDENGEHGQGRIFLDIFLDLVDTNIPKNDFDIFTEYSIDKQRRIDILLKNKEFAILIENKPYADDQKDQIPDYIKYCKQKEFNIKNIYAVYLAPDEKMPQNIDKNRNEIEEIGDNFKNISFVFFKNEFLKPCYEKCESEKFRFFIEDFMNFIDKDLQISKGAENENRA